MMFKPALKLERKSPISGNKPFPDYREPIVPEKNGFIPHQAVSYKTPQGAQVAVVYLHELCELE